MSSLGSVLNNALRSMTANQLALSVASNNIANAGNPEFTRQRLDTKPAGPDGTVLGIGMGVDVVGVEAVRDSLIEARLRNETSAKSGADTLASGLSNVEALFNDSDGTGLLTQLTNFFNSFQTLSQDPASVSFREQVKVNANSLVAALHSRNQDLQMVRANADAAVAADISEINRLASQIADVTKEIKYEETNHPANDLRDQRSALVKELSQYVEVRELDQGSEYQLSTKDNHLLVIDEKAQALSASDATPSIGAGSLKAHLDTRDAYVPQYLAALDQIAYEVSNQVNSIHSAGYDLDGNTGNNFFTPLASATDASRTISLDAAVAGDTRKIAAGSLSAGSDNQAAVQIGNLLHAPVFSGGSLTDQYGSLVFKVGADSSAAQSSVEEHESLVAQLENRRQSVSGVSIDEETIQILQFQRSFQASARLIQTVDQLLQVTLGLGQ